MPSYIKFIGVYLVIILTAPIAPFSICIFSDRRDGDGQYGNYRKDIAIAYSYYYSGVAFIIWSFAADLIVEYWAFAFRTFMVVWCSLGFLFGLPLQLIMVSKNYMSRYTMYRKLEERRRRINVRSLD